MNLNVVHRLFVLVRLLGVSGVLEPCKINGLLFVNGVSLESTMNIARLFTRSKKVKNSKVFRSSADL